MSTIKYVEIEKIKKILLKMSPYWMLVLYFMQERVLYFMYWDKYPQKIKS